MESRPRVLHVGCGVEPLPDYLSSYEEVRLDIDQNCNPDIVADMADIGDIGQFDVVFCCHSLEHLWPHEADNALNGFFRVLSPLGALLLFVPDLEGVTPDDRVLFESGAGPVTGHDLFYGHGPQLEERPYMAHKTGFVAKTLKKALERAGFSSVTVERLACYNLVGGGVKL